MDSSRFDDLTRKLGTAISRRRLLKAFAAGAAASLLPFSDRWSGAEESFQSVRTASAQNAIAEPFRRTWERTDKPVADGVLIRTWMWGPQPNTEPFYEAHIDAPGEERGRLAMNVVLVVLDGLLQHVGAEHFAQLAVTKRMMTVIPNRD